MNKKIMRLCFSSIFILIVLVQCKKDNATVNNSVSPNGLLSSRNYDKLVVEVQSISGSQPTQAALDNLTAFLQQRLNKPAGISIVQTTIASPGKTAYSLEDVAAIEKANRSQNTNGKTITAYFLFLDGDYASNSGNSKILGFAYGKTSMVIFEKTVKEFSGGLGKPPVQTLESTVINHEFGHILGLVNNGTPLVTAHQDGANGHHCSNKNCLMYYTAETSDIVANIIGGNVPELDASCIKDLQSSGGK